MPNESNFRPYGVESRARPCRLAFLIDPDDCPPELLDSLFSTNYELWGGRFNPLIPVRKGIISDAHWALLQYVDPDIIYTHVPLSESVISSLDCEIAPLRFEARFKHLRQSPPYYPASYGEMLVKSAHILPLVASMLPLPGQKAKVLTYEAGWKWPHRRFVARNFGLLNEQRLLPLPEGPDRLPIQATWDVPELLKQLAASRNLIFPFQAGEAYSGFPQPAAPSEPHYCILFGDSVDTWLHFWNRVFVLPHYLRSAWNTLCLPMDFLTDTSLDLPLREFIRRFTHRSSDQSPYLALQSFECEEKELNTISERILKNLDVYPRVKKLGIGDFVAPSTQTYFHLSWGASLVTNQQATTEDALLSPPTSPVSLNTGTWMMDMRIQYIPRFPFYGNEVLSWMLPKHFGVANAFAPGHASRIDRTHCITVEMRNQGPFRLRRPSEGEVLQLVLEGAAERKYSEDLRVKETKRPFDRVTASDKALYVRGMTELFEGLQNAGHFFEHSFWRGIFEHLSKRGVETERKLIERVKNRVGKHRDTIATQLAGGSGEPVEWLSRFVIQLAREHGSDEPDIAFAQLRDQFHVQREQYILKDPNFRSGASEEQVHRDQEEATQDLQNTVQWLVNSGIFLQGIRVRCTNCGTGYWREMGVIQQKLTCEGCGATIYSPIEPTWRYRLNSLVRNGIALHGCVAVILALHDLRDHAHNAFIYTPGVVLYRNPDDSEPEAEIDLLCISDGQLICGEVKSVSSEFTLDELKKLARVARELRADRVLVFAFRDDKRLMQKFEQQLAAIVHSGCHVSAGSASQMAFEPQPHA